MNYEDFIRKPEESVKNEEFTEEKSEPANEDQSGGEVLEDNFEDNIDVQRAVVESLAAEKAVQDAEMAKLKEENKALQEKCEKQEAEISITSGLKNALEQMEAKLATLKKEIDSLTDNLARNSEKELSTQVTLLERSEVLEDRFEGESRDHVLEILKEAWEAAERDGRLRRAQILEAILRDNEISGELQRRRQELEKLFVDNMNVINGQVINSLDNMGIRYKDGEKYLIAEEIIKRSY